MCLVLKSIRFNDINYFAPPSYVHFPFKKNHNTIFVSWRWNVRILQRTRDITRLPDKPRQNVRFVGHVLSTCVLPNISVRLVRPLYRLICFGQARRDETLELGPPEIRKLLFLRTDHRSHPVSYTWFPRAVTYELFTIRPTLCQYDSRFVPN